MPTPETNKPSQAELLALLGKAQAADLTAMKTASIINRSGHQITGFVVCHPETHERCIVEMSACRWLTNDEMWWLMHVSESPLNPKKPETFPCRECGKPGLGIPNAICPICGGEYDRGGCSVQRLVGRHSWCELYHADCKDVLPLACDAVVTDPPYGIGFAAQPTKWQRRAGKVAESWDDTPGEVDGLLQLAPLVAIWGGNYYPLPLSRGWLVWHKPDAVPSMANAELAWTNQDRNTRQISWSISATNAERVGHPTQKPVRVMAWTLEQLGVPKGATVLDPYMGSGTTAIACIRLGMNFIGIERDAAHYKTACDRIAHELDGALL